MDIVKYIMIKNKMYKILISICLLLSCSSKYDEQWHNEQMQITQFIFEKQMEIKQESVNCISHNLSGPGVNKNCNAINEYGFYVKYTCYSRGWHDQRKYCTLN